MTDSKATEALLSGIDVPHGIERFTAFELATLRSDLLRSGVDSFEAAEIVTSFLSGRGYGISTEEARHVASKGFAGSVEPFALALENAARAA